MRSHITITILVLLVLMTILATSVETKDIKGARTGTDGPGKPGIRDGGPQGDPQLTNSKLRAAQPCKWLLRIRDLSNLWHGIGVIQWTNRYHSLHLRHEVIYRHLSAKKAFLVECPAVHRSEYYQNRCASQRVKNLDWYSRLKSF